jgi:hypothetical protein
MLPFGSGIITQLRCGVKALDGLPDDDNPDDLLRVKRLL